MACDTASLDVVDLNGRDGTNLGLFNIVEASGSQLAAIEAKENNKNSLDVVT